MAAPLVPWVNDGDAGNAAVTKRPLKYILTASGMDVDNTGFTGVKTSYNLKAFGAIGNGIADDTIAINAWYAAIPDGGEGFVPLGGYRFTSTLSFNRSVNIVCEGVGAAFIPDVGASADGIVFNNTVNANLYRIRVVLNIFSATTNCCRNGLIFNRVHNSDEILLHVKVKAVQWGVTFNGCLSNQKVLVISSTNYSYPWPAAMATVGTIRGTYDAVNVIALNANKFKVLVEGGCDQMRIEDQLGFGNNHVAGVLEGQSSGTRGFYAKGCAGLHISDLHFESTASYPVELDTCSQSRMGPNCMLYGESIILTACRSTKLDGVQTDSLTLAGACDRIEVGNLTYNVASGTGTITDPTNAIIQTGPIVNAAGTSTQMLAGSVLSDATNPFPNGDFERWNAGDSVAPNLWTFIANNPAWVKCGTALGDTMRNFSRYCAKVTCATTGDAAAFPLDWGIVANQWVTVWAWVRVPAGQPNVTLKFYLNAGAAVRVGPVVTAKDVFTKVSMTFYCDGASFASALGVLMPVTNGNFYLADCGYRVGHGSPNRVLPNSTVAQTERILDGLAEKVSVAIPSTGTYRQGDFVKKSGLVVAGAAASQYVVTGWLRLTTGSAHVLNTDWAEARTLTGT